MPCVVQLNAVDTSLGHGHGERSVEHVNSRRSGAVVLGPQNRVTIQCGQRVRLAIACAARLEESVAVVASAGHKCNVVLETYLQTVTVGEEECRHSSGEVNISADDGACLLCESAERFNERAIPHWRCRNVAHDLEEPTAERPS